jgi:hypothetical protein
MLVVCMGIEALWQFQLHTQYVKKLGFIEKFLNTTPCIKYTTHRILNMDKTMVGFNVFLIEFFGLGNS